MKPFKNPIFIPRGKVKPGMTTYFYSEKAFHLAVRGVSIQLIIQYVDPNILLYDKEFNTVTIKEGLKYA